MEAAGPFKGSFEADIGPYKAYVNTYNIYIYIHIFIYGFVGSILDCGISHGPLGFL